jgi:hypothetical protein
LAEYGFGFVRRRERDFGFGDFGRTEAFPVADDAEELGDSAARAENERRMPKIISTVGIRRFKITPHV